MSISPLTESLGALGSFFVGERTIEETLQAVVDLTLEALPKATMAGLTTLVDGRPATSVHSGDNPCPVDEAQYIDNDGPCLTAFRERRAVKVDDAPAASQWPGFAAAAAEHGVGSSLSLPLVLNNEGIGALNLYAPATAAFADEDRAAGELFATQTAVVLANARAYWDARSLGEHLGEAMRSRATIEQAKGILMSNQKCGPDEAFNLLVRASQRENVKLREIANRIVDRATSGDPLHPGNSSE